MTGKTKGMVAVVTVVCLLMVIGSTAMAAQEYKQATLYYNDIKITLDGTPLVPKDVTGKVVEPFIIDGTTYLPIRAVGGALGLGVDWNPQTSTVLLTSGSGGGDYIDGDVLTDMMLTMEFVSAVEVLYSELQELQYIIFINYERMCSYGGMPVAHYNDYLSYFNLAMAPGGFGVEKGYYRTEIDLLQKYLTDSPQSFNGRRADLIKAMSSLKTLCSNLDTMHSLIVKYRSTGNPTITDDDKFYNSELAFDNGAYDVIRDCRAISIEACDDFLALMYSSAMSLPSNDRTRPVWQGW